MAAAGQISDHPAHLPVIDPHGGSNRRGWSTECIPDGGVSPTVSALFSGHTVSWVLFTSDRYQGLAAKYHPLLFCPHIFTKYTH